MKVFLVGDRNEKLSKEAFKIIVSELEKQGHKVDKSWISKTSEDDSKHFEDAYERSMKSIKNCDVLVAEVSSMSSGIGFLISTALNQKKPVLAIYNSESKESQSITLKGSKNRLFSYQVYSKDNLPSVVQGFAAKAKSILDTKFILIISPEIDRYLEWASAQKRMHKAQLVRNAVEDMMKKDREWKESN